MCRSETKSSSATMMWSASSTPTVRSASKTESVVALSAGEGSGKQHAARAALERVFHNFAHIELDAVRVALGDQMASEEAALGVKARFVELFLPLAEKEV